MSASDRSNCWTAWRAAALIASLVVCPAFASQGGASVADLAHRALDIERAAPRVVDATQDLYILARLDDLRVRSLAAHFDDAPAVRATLSPAESEALARGAAYRLRLPPSAVDEGGRHLHLEAELGAANESRASRRVRVDGGIALSAGTRGEPISLRLIREGVLRRHAFVRVGKGEAVPATDPRVAHAELLLATGRPYLAATMLTAVETGRDGDDRSPGIAELHAAVEQALSGRNGRPATDESEAPVAVHYRDALADRAEGRDVEAAARLRGLLEAADANDPVSHAYRDQAHLLLAQHAFAQGQRAKAADHFQSVRSTGPFATRALLGLGWSQLLPAVDSRADVRSTAATSIPVAWATPSIPLRSESDDARAQARRRTPFRYFSAVATGDRAQVIERALAVWQELIGRDPIDPAVQEGMIAIGYAFQHLGAQQPARQRYERALVALESAHAQLSDAIAHARDGRMLAAAVEAEPIGWPWWAVERRQARWWMNPDKQADPHFYIAHLLEDAVFRAALTTYETLQAIDRRMATVSASLADQGAATPGLPAAVDALRGELRAALVSRSDELEARAVEMLEARRNTTEGYMAEAHMALARLHDVRAPGTASSTGREAQP